MLIRGEWSGSQARQPTGGEVDAGDSGIARITGIEWVFRSLGCCEIHI